MTIKEIEEAFLKGIENSDFLYLVDMHGYVGNSAAFEVGYAFAKDVPIFASEKLSQLLDADSINDLGIIIAPPQRVLTYIKEHSSKT